MALLFLALLPLALPWGLVCFGGLAGDAFHLGVSMRWSSTHRGLTSGSSGSLASRFELLVGHFWVPQILCLTSLPRVWSCFLVSGIAVRALLLATSLPLDMVVSLGPGRCLSVSTFSGWFSVLKVLVLKCRVLPFSWALTLLA